MAADKPNSSPVAAMPTPEEAVDHLQSLVQIWEAHGEQVTVPVIDGSLLTGVCVQVQVEHTVRLTEAIILLAREGLFIQIAPLARMAMECAVSAAWWTLNPDNVKGSVAEAARMKQLLIKGVAAAAGKDSAPHPDWEAMSEEFDTFRSAESKKFEQRCNALKGGESLYSYYRLLSEASHGGTAILDEYLQTVPKTESNPLGYVFQRHAPYKHLATVLAVSVIVLAYALSAWDSITEGHPDAAALAKLGAVLGTGFEVAPAS